MRHSNEFGNEQVDIDLKLPPFGTLSSLGLVKLSGGEIDISVDRHFFFDIMMLYVKKIEFDEEFYLNTYPDIRRSVESGLVSSARDHYVRFGYYEHRFPHAIRVDEDWYLENYADVRNAIARRDFVSCQDHFAQAGFREGRLPYPNFSLIEDKM